ncbi:MAG TPA: glycoside hydrolase family 95 protein, partial [Sphingomonas sp.]|nr:glycoside hydrolase family 95 protein [Sphingomonas sp.]
MDRRNLLATAGAAFVLPAMRTRAATPPPTNPHVLWYTAPAKEWVEALPVGNGRIGAMVFGGTATEQLQLNEDTLWAGGSYDPANPRAHDNMAALRTLIFDKKYAEAEAFANANVMATPLRQAAYQTVGSLMIEMPGIAAASAYRRELDLDSALAETRFTANGATYRRRVIASPVDQVVAVHLTADKPGAISAKLRFTCPLKSWQAAAEGSDMLVLSGRNNDHFSIPGALRFEARLKAIANGGRVIGAGDSLTIEGADAVTLLIAMATSYRRHDDVSGDPAAITRG